MPDAGSTMDEGLFTVSVVVFYKRNLLASTNGLTSGERIIGRIDPIINRQTWCMNVPYTQSASTTANSTNAHAPGAIATQEWEFGIVNDGSVPKEAAANDRNVKAGQYIMLAGAVDLLPSANPDPQNHARQCWSYKWYRVVGVNAEVKGPYWYSPPPNNPNPPPPPGWVRQVTLAGPDWNPQTDNNKLDQYKTQAFLFDGVIAVYERTMKLEGPGVWTSY